MRYQIICLLAAIMASSTTFGEGLLTQADLNARGARNDYNEPITAEVGEQQLMPIADPLTGEPLPYYVPSLEEMQREYELAPDAPAPDEMQKETPAFVIPPTLQPSEAGADGEPVFNIPVEQPPMPAADIPPDDMPLDESSNATIEIVQPVETPTPETSGTPAPTNEIQLNFKDVDIRQVIQTVAELTKQNFLIDPRVRGTVNIISAEPIKIDALYQVFLTILDANNFIAVPGDGIVKIMPSNTMRYQNFPVEGIDKLTAVGAELVTTIVHIEHARVGALEPLLRPLLPPDSFVASYPQNNDLVITAPAATIERLRQVIAGIDKPLSDDTDTEVIRFTHASAVDALRVVRDVHGNTQPVNGEPPPVISADPRTNSLIIRGSTEQRLTMRALAAHLDTPIAHDEGVQVIYLHYAEAEKIAEILTKVLQTTVTTEAQSSNQLPTSVEADKHTNSLVITASPEKMQMIQSIIRRLDIRKAQVLVEAIIADVSTDWLSEFGVQWRSLSTDTGGVIGLVNFGGSNPIATSVTQNADGVLSLANAGLGAVIGGEIDNWLFLLNALQNDARANILSRPTIMTLDNEEAEIFVGEDVPFVSSASGGDTPTTTVQRRNVGIRLSVLPKINEGDSVQLRIEQEVSSLKPQSQQTTGAVDLITTNRKINTNIIVSNGETIVLGGLVQEGSQLSNQKVPVLGDIPLLGALFRYKRDEANKGMLMVFMRPTILRDSATAMAITHGKYNTIRNQQLLDNTSSSRLNKQAPQPLLDPLTLPPSFREAPRKVPDDQRGDDASTQMNVKRATVLSSSPTTGATLPPPFALPP